MTGSANLLWPICSSISHLLLFCVTLNFHRAYLWLFPLLWFSVLPSFLLKLMTKILTVLQALLCVFGHVNLHVSLPSSPLLPTCGASMEFVPPASRPSSITLSLPVIPAPPLLHLNNIRFRYVKMKHQTTLDCLGWPLSILDSLSSVELFTFSKASP